MSAPQIPNLLASRGEPRLRAGRGRGRGRGGTGIPEPRPSNDSAIQSTDTDAAVSRLSAVSLGYLEDPFASAFVNGPGTRRMPIINRGTYTRTTALDILINAFLAETNPSINVPQTKQIISLGAGTDTRYFRLRAKDKHRNLIYHEIDFPSVTATKLRIVQTRNLLVPTEDEAIFTNLRNGVPEVPDQNSEWGVTQLSGGKSEITYCCHPMDLRDLSRPKETTSVSGLRTDVPTLIISECCLCYLDVSAARDVVKWFADRISSLGIVLYEPIGVDDSFGQVMVSNLAARNISMPTLEHYKTLSDQKTRLRELGFSRDGNDGDQEAETIEKIWQNWVPATEKERVDRLEGLDEVEEWQMLARHYAVAWGWRGSAGWRGWAGLRNG